MADRSVVYRLRAEIGQFRAQMAQASASTKKLAGDLTGIDKEGAKARRGLDTLGSAAGKVGLVAAAGLGAAVVASANFDQAMSKVEAATHESAANMERLREAALKAGADTAFSASEAATGIENLAKAGISTKDILAGGLDGALDLAAAGEMEVADAAEAAAGAMAQFKLEGDQATHVADLLAAGAGKAQGDVSDMVMALKQAGTVSSQTGLSIEETTGSLAALAEQSLLGSDAGTSFKQMLGSLTPNSDKAAAAMEEYNIHAFDAKGNFVGMAELAGQLRDGLGDLTAEQRASTLETIFGSDAVRAASIIYDNGAEGIQNWINKTNDSGYAAETASIKLDNLAGDLEAFKGSLETALIGTGDGAQGPLRSLVQGATDVVNAFNELSPAAKSAVGGIMGGAAVVGGSIWVGSKLIQGLANTRQAFDDLNISAKNAGRAASLLKGSLALGGAIVALGAVDALLDSISDHDFSDTDLDRQLEAFASGELVGNLDKIGEKLAHIQLDEDGLTGVDKLVGMIPTVSNDAEEAATNIEKIDQALALMVESGDPDKAAKIFTGVQEQAEKAGVSVDTVTDSFDAYNLALRNAAGPGVFGNVLGAIGKFDLAAAATKAAADETAALGRKSEKSAKQVAAMKEALREERAAARETGAAFFGLGEKVDKAKVSLGEWLRDLEKQAAALRDFRKNAEAAAKNGLSDGLIAALKEAGPVGALRMKQLADATDAEIKRANKAWQSGQREIGKYVDSTVKVPKKITTDLNVNTGQSLSLMDRAAKRLSDLDGKTATMILNLRSVRSGPGGQGLGYDGFADGGHTGWGDPSDVAGVVHGREFVFSADATRGNEAALDKLHRQLRGYADGGYVSASRSMQPISPNLSASLDIDYGRLAGELARVRPVYGDVHVSGDNSFQRELLAEKQRRGLGGL